MFFEEELLKDSTVSLKNKKWTQRKHEDLIGNNEDDHAAKTKGIDI